MLRRLPLPLRILLAAVMIIPMVIVFAPIKLILALLRGGYAPPVIDVAPDDPEMLAAIERARATTPELLARLADPPATQTHVAVKVPLQVAGKRTEHVWVTNVRHDAGEIVGTIDNDTLHATTYDVGTSVRTPLAELSDWMAVDDGRLVGGYSVLLLRSRMTEKQRARFDRKVPFRVEGVAA